MLAWTVRANVEGIEAADFKRGDRTYDIRVNDETRREQVASSCCLRKTDRPSPSKP